MRVLLASQRFSFMGVLSQLLNRRHISPPGPACLYTVPFRRRVARMSHARLKEGNNKKSDYGRKSLWMW